MSSHMADTPPDGRPDRWSGRLASFDPPPERENVDAYEAVVIGAVALLALVAIVSLAVVSSSRMKIEVVI